MEFLYVISFEILEKRTKHKVVSDPSGWAYGRNLREAYEYIMDHERDYPKDDFLFVFKSFNKQIPRSIDYRNLDLSTLNGQLPSSSD